jgi:hypothetical protein
MFRYSNATAALKNGKSGKITRRPLTRSMAGPITRSMSANRKIKSFGKVASLIKPVYKKTNSGRSIAKATKPKSLFKIDYSLGTVELVKPMSKMTKVELWNCDIEFNKIMKTLATQDIEMYSAVEEELLRREQRGIFNGLRSLMEDSEDSDDSDDSDDTESLDEPIDEPEDVESIDGPIDEPEDVDESIETINNIDLGLSEDILLDMSCLSREEIDNLYASMLGKFVKVVSGPDMETEIDGPLFKLEEKLQKNSESINYNNLVFRDRTNGVVIKFFYDFIAMYQEFSGMHRIDDSQMIGATQAIKIKNVRDPMYGLIHKYVNGIPLNDMSKELLFQYRDTICDQYADFCEELRVKNICINKPLERRLRDMIFDMEDKTLHFIDFENVEQYRGDEETEENARFFDRLNMLTCLNTHINKL